MEELIPVLVARLNGRAELISTLEAALKGALAFLPLDEAPSSEGAHALELWLRDWDAPVVVRAEPAGEDWDGRFPLFLRCLESQPREDLLATLAYALCAAREVLPVTDPEDPATAEARLQFIASLRAIGPPAMDPIGDALLCNPDDAFAEDLLRSVPDRVPPRSPSSTAPDPGEVIADFLRHSAAAVRRAAVTALTSVWGANAEAWLDPLLEDPDDGVRSSVMGAFRRELTDLLDREG